MIKKKTKVFAVEDLKFVTVDGVAVEVEVGVTKDGLLPKLVHLWELGEVKSSPKLEKLDLGDQAKITQADEDSFSKHVGLVPGAQVECVMLFSSI